MFGAWEYAILGHANLLSMLRGWRHKNDSFSKTLNLRHCKLFQVLLQPDRRPTVGKFWAI